MTIEAATARFATLPMYDFPDARAATDAWWAGLARHLSRQGVRDVPTGLLRGDDLLGQWQDGRLLLSQTCSYILTHYLRDHARPVAVPCYDAAGCAGPNYRSVIVVHEDHPGASLAAFRGGNAVYSRAYSHAGYNSFRGMIAPLAGGRPFFSTVSATDSHLGSLAAVASRTADIATIDCVIHAFVARYRPHLLAGTRMIGYTPLAPAPPYIVPMAATDEATRIGAALAAAAADPDLRAARETLFLDGFVDASAVNFSLVDEIENAAIAAGYAELR
jgi:ABC-type phosphate/phosphonate transport system substrate-binding protein